MGTTNHHHHHHHHQPTTFPIKKLITGALYTLLPLALLHVYLFPISLKQPKLITSTQSQKTSSPSIPSSLAAGEGVEHRHSPRSPRCDYSDGRWVPDSRGPRYNGTSCSTIKDGQNCMAHGRPDTGYLYWRWQPNHCQLPAFDPVSFLHLIQNKHLAFVGDSMARNQLESLLCLLSAASPPELVYRDGQENKFRRWVFHGYNATVSIFWCPFLVKGIEKSAAPGLNHNKLYLDSADDRWASELDRMDMVVFSVGHWFLHPAIYYENELVLGCHHCPELNHTEIGFFDVFRKAFKTTLKVVSSQDWSSPASSEKLVVVTTFSPAHFEGEWDKFGACPKKKPYKEGEKGMEYMDAEMRKIEVEEVEAAASKGAAKSGGRLRIEALDVTKLALLRPDGHPGPYMYPNPFADGIKEKVQNDCVHWCLPGPIDTWNEILLEMIKRWK
ncbi:xyloglucan O-acetyltransferase 2 isoform X1 [Elaeis guineensis]|uniref:Protein ALTERED XYLOGLUCAN 4 isoform X1 n=1 Tax=Elaeis guineensis var. tenera TaxID=51953 RepID=A0A6I9RKZ0_ELAGV|nr:protein ALTERED XYLOGLUCAN 4 isoform X1 [Elaeis guineensis]